MVNGIETLSMVNRFSSSLVNGIDILFLSLWLLAFTHHFWLINFSSLLVNALVNIVTIMLTEYGYFVNDDLERCRQYL